MKNKNIEIKIDKAVKDVKTLFLDNILSILLGVILIAGVFIGARMPKIPIAGDLIFSGSFYRNFISCFFSVLVYHIVIYLFGTSLFFAGAPIALFIRGLGIGGALFSLYDSLGKSLSYWSLLILIPHFFLVGIMLIYSCRISFISSMSLISAVRMKNSRITEQFKRYSFRSLLIFFAVILLSLIYSFAVMFMQPILILNL